MARRSNELQNRMAETFLLAVEDGLNLREFFQLLLRTCHHKSMADAVGQGVIGVPPHQRLLLYQVWSVVRPAEGRGPLQDRLHQVPQVIHE